MDVNSLALDIYARLIASWVAAGRPLDNKTVEGFADMAIAYARIMQKKMIGA